MDSKLNAKREFGGAFKRLPVIAVAITGALIVGIAVLIGCIYVVGVMFMSNPLESQAADVVDNGAGRAQAVVGLADCLATGQCPDGRSPAEDAENLVADTSRINGTTFTDLDVDGWKKWGRTFMLYGNIDQNSVRQISGSTSGQGKETVQVSTTNGTTLICDADWADTKLAAWQCYADRQESR